MGKPRPTTTDDDATPARRLGRPPRAGSAATRGLRVRLTDAEAEAIDRAAAATDSPRAVWARTILLRAARQARKRRSESD